MTERFAVAPLKTSYARCFKGPKKANCPIGIREILPK